MVLMTVHFFVPVLNSHDGKMDEWLLSPHLGPVFGADRSVLQLELQGKRVGQIHGPRGGRLPLYKQLSGLGIHLLTDQFLRNVRLYYTHAHVRLSFEFFHLTTKVKFLLIILS